MKRISIFLMAAAFLAACQSKTDTHSPESPNPIIRSSTESNGGDLVGGWTMQNLDSPLVEENRMILTAILEKRNPDVVLGRIQGVWTQVVAGHNVRIMANYTKGTQEGVLTAILFHDLEGNAFLKSIDL